MLGPYGVRYSWVYWPAIAAAFALLIVDLFDDGAIWNIGVVVLIVMQWSSDQSTEPRSVDARARSSSLAGVSRPAIETPA